MVDALSASPREEVAYDAPIHGPETSSQSPSDPAPDQAQGSELHVLIVEDDSFQRLAISQLFDAANSTNADQIKYVATAVDSPTAALNYWRSRHQPRCIDLLVLDVFFGEGEDQVRGYELLPELRRCLGDQVAILMLSAHQEFSLVQTCLEGGADAYLMKPIRADEVRNLWQYCARKRNLTLPISLDKPPQARHASDLASSVIPRPAASLGADENVGLRQSGGPVRPPTSPRPSNESAPRSTRPLTTGGSGFSVLPNSNLLAQAASAQVTPRGSSPLLSSGRPGPAGTPGGSASHNISVYSRCRRWGSDTTGRLMPMHPVGSGAEGNHAGHSSPTQAHACNQQ
jgi:CheY-like chemotaxis protein